MIETENLTRKFGDLTAVDDLTLRVDDGEVFGFPRQAARQVSLALRWERMRTL